MNLILIIFRLPLVIIHLISGILILIFFPKKLIEFREIHHQIVKNWMRILLWLFGLKIKKIGNIEMESSMFVSNHVSFIDIIVLNSIMDIKFVAKSEKECHQHGDELYNRKPKYFLSPHFFFNT